MTAQGKPPGIEQVACGVCLKEVPKSEAMVAEATDYVLHFCGLDCYAKWQAGEEKAKQAGGGAGSK